MTTYLLIDLTNTYFRARHTAHRASTTEEKVAFAIHVTLASINKCWRDQKGDHVVFCLEGRSWRKDFYKPYKANRSEARAALSVSEAEEDRAFWEGLDHLKDYFRERTNCTVLQHPELEADDLIAGWIQTHTNDKHIIVSSDSDFHQLLADNVKQYNGVTDELHTLEGIFNYKGQLVIDKKTKEAKTAPNPEWLLFEKCMRGDTSDNIFSAYPGVREKGTKNKVGLREAFADRDNKGFMWNNLMLQKWVDHNGVEHRVLDDYYRNVKLCDLSAQPDDIQQIITECITAEEHKTKNISQVGIRLLKFCAEYDLQKISEQVQSYAEPLNARYSE